MTSNAAGDAELAEAAGPEGTDARLPAWFWTFGAALFVASFAATGYRVFAGNHAHQLPLVYFLNDPELYAGDPFGKTLAAHPSLFWRGVALAARAAPLEGVLLALFVMERALLFAGVIALARAFAPGSALAAMAGAALAAVCMSPIVGEGTITREYTEQTGMAVPCCLLALAAFYQRRPRAAACWFAAAWNLNSLYGIFAGSYIAAAAAADREIWKDWKRWGEAAALAAALCVPAALLTVSAVAEEPVESGLWLRVAKTFMPYHLCPSAVQKPWWAWLAIFAGGAAAVFAGPAARGEPKLRRAQAAWGIVAAAWLALAFAAERSGRIELSLLQCLRGPDLWCALAGAGACAALARAAEAGAGGRRMICGAALVAMLVFWKRLVFPPWMLAIPILAAGLPPVWRWLAAEHPRRFALVLMAAIAGMNVAEFGRRAERIGSPSRAIYDGAEPAIADVARWAEAATPKDAVFFAHPMIEGFRPLLKRPQFLSAKDAGAIFWHRAFARDFAERLAAIRFDFENPRAAWPTTGVLVNELFYAIRDDELAELKKRYRIDYWIVPATRVSRFPTAYENGAFRVLDARE